jgi:hypothetical protein
MSEMVQSKRMVGKCSRQGRSRTKCIALDGKGQLSLGDSKWNLVTVLGLSQFSEVLGFLTRV